MRLTLILGALAGLLPQVAAPSGATLRGRVFDPDGRPFVGVEIAPFVLTDVGERVIGPSRLTADDGTFEMTGLKPGPLYLRATPRLRRVRFTREAKDGIRAILGHPPVYYPGVLDRKDAWPIDLAAGETVEFDFHIPPVLAASIKATVTGPPGHTLEQLRVMRPASNAIRSAKVVDGVVAGIGIEPDVRLAEGAGLEVGDGIVVDEFLRTSSPDVYAAGDVANFYNPDLDERLRVEHEDNANTMGLLAGRNMAGAAEPYHHLPFFYSDLFELGYEAVGEVDARLETVADWKDLGREGVVYYLREGQVRGVLLWNVWEQVDAARRLIAEPGPFEADDLKGRLPEAQ